MAKTIKFNLICDEKPVRTVEDLRNNFSIEDVLAYYNNQLLHRWLRVRGYDQELESVSSVTSTEPMEIIKELIRIFDVVTNEEKVREDIYMLKYLDERKKRCAIYEQEKYNTIRIIEDYEAGYSRLVEEILDNPNDAAKIKANIAEMVSNYALILKLNHRELFYILIEKSVLAVMCLLMNEKSRNYYLPVEKTDEDGAVTLDTSKNPDKEAMFKCICRMIQSPDFETKLEGNLVSFSGYTDEYWKDLAPKGKRYMIVSIGNGDYVRAAGHSGGDLSRDDVLDKFVIVDGIDYKSNYRRNKLLYMEV